MDPRAIERHFARSPFVADVGFLGSAEDGRARLIVVPDVAELRRNGLTGVRELIRFEFETLAVQHQPALLLPETVFTFDPLPRTADGALDTERIPRDLTAHAVLRRRTALPDSHAVALVRAAIDAQRRNGGATTIDADTNLELDLGLDSLARAALFADVERRLGHAPTTSGLTCEDVFSVADLVARVEALPAGTTAPSPGPFAPRDGWADLLAGPPEPAVDLDAGRTLRAAGFWLTLRVLRIVTWPVLRITVLGREHLPPRGPALICPNHESFFDAFIVSAVLPYRLLRDTFYLGATEYFVSPTMAFIARMINLVPVDADRNVVRALRVGAAGLRDDKVLVIFPEGERTIDGTVRTFRDGTAHLSQATGAPMLPVALRGMFGTWPRGFGLRWQAFRPWNPVHVTVSVGTPIQAPPAASVEQATRVLRDTVQSLWHDAGVDPSQRRQ